MRDCADGIAVPAGLDVNGTSSEFWNLLMMPNASTSRPHWHSTLAAPLTRTRRYFCCATAQREKKTMRERTRRQNAPRLLKEFSSSFRSDESVFPMFARVPP